MKKYSVAIVEDYKLLSQAIGEIINSFDNFELLYTCENGKELIEKIKLKNIPDIILMDVNMPIMGGIETTKWLQKTNPEIHILALTVEDDEKTIITMIKSGAKGYLLKDVDKSTLENAMISLMKNGIYHTKLVNDAMFHSINEDEFNLKENEIKFMELVCTEMTYKEIADKMFLSPKTIDGYRDHLFSKLNVKNRIGLVLFAIKNKIYVP
ncbi:two component transcriptional regulator, LuxR family [Halpernia humi]|uniref:Two component transcriptional regulator, LuxR family n=1 Tax=Halpernia humi TaxID=493375 RepID=A0A1H5YTZ4_9FLAO|nr:response regulator transcription factor [Halpernia humi]SEG27182.1 two component transcriptional regulator, LuxR family [Halpernia humi]